MDDLNYNVAVNLKRIRREKGMSLEGMAEQTGVSKSMLAQIEKRDCKPFSWCDRKDYRRTSH